MNDLSLRPIGSQQRVADCRTLYALYQGRHHHDIQAGMRALGHERWNRRCLYASRDRSGRRIPGWPERFGFKSEPPASAGGLTPASEQAQGKTVSPTPQPKPPANFRSWLLSVSPEYKWNWKYQQHIIEKLKLVYEGKLKRLMIFVPPRHGKSELVTVRFAAWCLRNKPKMNIIIGSYNQKLANRFSRKIRNITAHAAAIGSMSSADGQSVPPAIAGGLSDDAADAVPRGKRRAVADADTPTAASATPEAVPRMRRIQTDAEWETAEGGGVRAVGVGAGITGFGADLIIIDDPVKSRAEAESQTIRDNLGHWFNDDLYTRLEPGGSIILIQTRWHEDDLAGRLLREMAEDHEAEQWEVIEFPALAEPKPEPPATAGGLTTDADNVGEEILPEPKPHLYYTIRGRCIPIRTIGNPTSAAEFPAGPQKITGGFGPNTGGSAETSPQPKASEDWRDELGRALGEPLCPQRFPLERLMQVKRKLGTYSFSALYQQRPTPAEGGFFKRHWFKIVDFAPPHLKWKRGYDLGIKADPGSDFTATARVGRDRDGNIYIDRVFRKRMEYPEQRRSILGLIHKEWDTEHLIEASANGNAVIQDLRRERSIMNRKFRGIRVRESKTARAFTWNALAEEGRVHLVRGAWNSEFIDEACAFPTGPHDDQIDAVSIAVRSLMEVGQRFYAF
ncbi:MAG: phage terminase large subunit [Pyrinomonadaceae bacterium]